MSRCRRDFNIVGIATSAFKYIFVSVFPISFSSLNLEGFEVDLIYSIYKTVCLLNNLKR